MARKTLILCVALAFAAGTIGCMAHVHTVGAGSKGAGLPVCAKQWYILWGLVPLNNVDSRYLAGDAADYTIRTRHSFIDFLINIFTGYVTIYSRTVEVYR